MKALNRETHQYTRIHQYTKRHQGKWRESISWRSKYDATFVIEKNAIIIRIYSIIYIRMYVHIWQADKEDCARQVN